MSMFRDNIADAPLTGGGTNIRDGKYIFMVERAFERTNHKKEGQFIAELRVMKSESVSEFAIAANGRDVTDKPVIPNAVGSACSVVVSSKHDSANSNIKKFLLGVLGGLGYQEEHIDGQCYTEATSGKNPLRGMLVECETFRTLNQGKQNQGNAGKILVLQKWNPIEQTADDIKRAREWLAKKEQKEAAPMAQTAPAAPAPAPAQPQPQSASRLSALLD